MCLEITSNLFLGKYTCVGDVASASATGGQLPRYAVPPEPRTTLIAEQGPSEC